MIHRFLHVCLCFVFFTEFSYSQYSIIPTNTTGLIKSIEKSGDYLLICGKENYLAKYRISTDELIPLTTTLGSEYNQYHIQMLDSNTFYTTGFIPSVPYHARIIRSMDGGQTWDDVLDTLSELFFVNQLLVFDTNKVVLLSTANKWFITNDGGQNWELYTAYTAPINTTTRRLNDTCAIYGSIGKIRFTEDKGESWQQYYSSVDPWSISAQSLDSIYYVASDIAGSYFACYFRQSNTHILKGLSWEPKGIYAFSKNEIYVTGGGGRIAKTTDLGNSWTYCFIPETNYLFDINFINDSIALIGGNHGVLVKWNKNSHFSGLSLEDSEQFGTNISILPNPSEQFQTIDFHESIKEILSVKIIDLSGKIIKDVFNGVLNENESKITIDISSLAVGSYQYLIQIGEETSLKNFVRF